MRQISSGSIAASLALGLLCTARAVSADQTFLVQVDTSALFSTQGAIDIQFNPIGVNSLPATATISDVQGDVLLNDPPQTIGDVTGTLSSIAVLNNTFQVNDLTQVAAFGNGFDFRVRFSGPALSPNPNALPDAGTVFTLGLLGSDLSTPLLSTANDGLLLRLAINPDGSFAINNDAGGGFQYVTATAVPEPGTLALIGAGIISCIGLAQRRRMRKAKAA